MPPTISVVIPVHNCLPYLEDTLASVYHQTLDRDEIEVVAVDDGSTDGSGGLLADWAERWPHLTVLTQPASGGPGAPRNVGIEHARGEFLFFLDGDDCLGPEALERLLAMARRHDSDIVLGKLVGVRRKVPDEVFVQDVADASLDSGIYYSLAPMKLIRRSLVTENGFRFPEHMRISEDQHFVASCYLAARRISVLASYDCYYAIRRHDRSNTSFAGLDYATVVEQADQTVELVLEKALPGAVQSHLVARHIKWELLRHVNRDFLRLAPSEQEAMVSVARPRAEAWTVPGVLEELAVPERLLLRAIRRGDVAGTREVVRWIADGARAPLVLHEGEWHVAGPGYAESGQGDHGIYATDPPAPVVRTEIVRVHGGVLTIGGFALLRGVDSGRCRTGLVLRHAETGREVPFDVQVTASPHVNALEGGAGVTHRAAGFRATMDLAASHLGDGAWLPRITVATEDYQRETRLPVPPAFSPLVSRLADADGAAVRCRVVASGRGALRVKLARPAATPSAGGPSRAVAGEARPLARWIRAVRGSTEGSAAPPA